MLAARLAPLGLVLSLLASGCAASLREQVTPYPAGAPRVVPWQLNRELLTPVNRRIQFVVDVAAGHAPEWKAIDDMTRLAARYGERPASWVRLHDAGAPVAHWDGDRLRVGGALDADTSYVFLRYVGTRIAHFGWSYAERVGDRTVYVILVNQERHREWRWLLPERRLEEQTLIHEYGHLLGLPSCDHGYYPLYPSFAEGAHCVNPDCALSKPRARAVLYGIANVIFRRRYLEDYCAACRRALADAKSYWRARIARIIPP
jgi:hypothetical protein